jgi:hypothetical protein
MDILKNQNFNYFLNKITINNFYNKKINILKLIC